MKKYLILIMLLPILINAQNKGEENFDILDYKYPLDSLKKAKVFIYKDMDNPENKRYRCCKVIKKNNENFCLKWDIEESRRDSLIFKVNDNNLILYEFYDIIENSDEKRVNKVKIVKWNRKENSFSSILEMDTNVDYLFYRIKSQTIFDTILKYEYKGKYINCIKNKELSAITTIDRRHSVAIQHSESLNSDGESIYAKNIGLIYYSTKNYFSQKITQWELERIIDLNDFKPK